MPDPPAGGPVPRNELMESSSQMLGERWNAGRFTDAKGLVKRQSVLDQRTRLPVAGLQ